MSGLEYRVLRHHLTRNFHRYGDLALSTLLVLLLGTQPRLGLVHSCYPLKARFKKRDNQLDVMRPSQDRLWQVSQKWSMLLSKVPTYENTGKTVLA